MRGRGGNDWSTSKEEESVSASIYNFFLKKTVAWQFYTTAIVSNCVCAARLEATVKNGLNRTRTLISSRLTLRRRKFSRQKRDRRKERIRLK